MRLWSAETISVFGSMIGIAAMSFTAILFLHATPIQMGILSAMSLVPAFIMSLLAGAWVDRLQRKPILIITDIGRSLLLMTIPLAAYFNILRIEQLYIVAFLISILTIFFNVAYQSFLPSLIDKKDLIEGNSKLSASSAVSEAGGFSLGGWLVQLFTGPVAILIDSVSFIFSAVFVSRISIAETISPGSSQKNLRFEIKEGIKELLQNPILKTFALCTFILELSTGIFAALVVLYMSQVLGFEPGILGMIWSVGGISSFAGAVLAKRMTKFFGIGMIMILCLILNGISMFFVPLAEGTAIFAAAVFLIIQQLLGDGSITIYEINQLSFRQAIVSERIIGRVNASMHFTGLGAKLTGSLFGGILGETIGIRNALITGACGALLSALCLLFSPVRNLRETPE